MPGIEVSGAVFIHELHQRKQDGSSCVPEFRMHRQRGYFSDSALVLADFLQVKNGLHGKTENTFANQRNGPDNLAVELGAQRGGGWQRVVNGNAHARWVRSHEATANIGIMKEPETRFQLFLGLCDLEDQSFVGVGIAINKRSVHRKPQGPVSYTHLRAHETDSYLV